MIIVLCFVFRNMPVGVRAGMAAMSQIDRSLGRRQVARQRDAGAQRGHFRRRRDEAYDQGRL